MEDLFDEMLMQARASGIEQPMLLLLSPNSQQAQTIYQALHGAPLQLPEECDGDSEWGPLEAVALAEVCRLFRVYAGVVGDCVARHLTDPTIPADFWLVGLLSDRCFFTAFFQG
jgi:hypothetical protein